MSRMFAVVSSDDQSPVFVKQGYVGFWPARPITRWRGRTCILHRERP
jgi:hypothetical protein